MLETEEEYRVNFEWLEKAERNEAKANQFEKAAKKNDKPFFSFLYAVTKHIWQDIK